MDGQKTHWYRKTMTDEMGFNQELIQRLRRMAAQGSTVRQFIDEIRNHNGTDDGLSLAVDAYLWKAFLLPLRQIRDVEGCTRLGGKLYTDEEVNQLLQPTFR